MAASFTCLLKSICRVWLTNATFFVLSFLPHVTFITQFAFTLLHWRAFRPDGQSPDTSGSKWPLKPGVLVHVNKMHNLNMSQLSPMALTATQFKTTAVAKASHKFIYKRNKNKVYARLRDFLGFGDQDAIPFGVYHSSSGGNVVLYVSIAWFLLFRCFLFACV